MPRSKLFIFRYLLLFFLISKSVFYLQAQNTGNWKLIKEKDHIKIYARKVNNFAFDELLGEYIAETNLSSLVSLLKDYHNQPNWVFANIETKLLKAPNDFEWYYYMKSDAPWPADDRDVIIHAVLSQDNDYTIHVNVRGLPNYLEKNKGVVRIPYLKSSWKFQPISKNKVLVQLRILTDIGGEIPAWMVNMVKEKGPLNTLMGMRKELSKEKYKNIELKFIKEKY